MSYEDLSFRIFTSKSEADKAIHSLKGILIGIALDNEINKSEINELTNWCENHHHLINRNPFKEFMELIKATVEGKIPEKETIEDLFWLTQKYEYDSYYFNPATSDLQTLQGICHGILSDGIIKDQEVLELNKWLKQNEHLATYYPYDELRSLLITVLKDKVIDEDERKLLKAYFKQFVKLSDQELTKQIEDDISNVRILGLCTSDPNIEISERTFCITGVLSRGTRKELENEIKLLGGILSDSITKKTDYLVVGDNGNPAWAFACYGRKVEKAIELRKEGHNITITNEFDFWDKLDDLKYLQ